MGRSKPRRQVDGVRLLECVQAQQAEDFLGTQESGLCVWPLDQSGRAVRRKRRRLRECLVLVMEDGQKLADSRLSRGRGDRRPVAPDREQPGRNVRLGRHDQVVGLIV